MLHAENLKVLYLKSPTSWRMNWRPCLVNSKEISVDFLKSILMKAKLPIENCYPWTNFINMFFIVSSSSICLLLILLKYENERIKHSVQLLSHVWFFVIPWTAACQASLSFTSSWSLLKLTSIELVMPPNHLILCVPFSSCLQSSQHQDLFKWVSSSHQVAKVLEFQLQLQSFQWIFRTDFL